VDSIKPRRALGFFSKEPELLEPGQRLRLANFANYTAASVRGSRNCEFSRLDDQELLTCVTTWYESCAQAMLKGNYALIDQWVCKQGSVAAKHGFELGALLELLRICRNSAIELERWDPDVLSPVNEVINETLRGGVTNPLWIIPADLDYLGGKPANSPSIESATALKVETQVALECERRSAERARMQLPIRIFGNGITGYRLDFATCTESISSTGLYFLGQEVFSAGLRLDVTCPFSKDPGASNKKFSARIVRVDRRPDKSRGFAIQFLEPVAGILNPEAASKRR
jgi:PilZ domain